MRVLDPHCAALDPLNPVGGIAEQEHIARHALDGEILVHRADHMVLGFEQHLIVGGVGDGAARGERGGSGAAPAAQHMIDGVVMQQCPAPAAPRGEALREHGDHRIEFGARQGPVWPRAAQALIERVLRPVLGGNLGDDLLGQHVDRLVGNLETVQLAAPHAVEESCAFDQIVARQREQPPLGRAADRMAGAPDPLQEAGDRARRAELADEIDIADIDAQLQRGGGDQRLQRAGLQPLLGGEPLLLRHAAVMGRDRARTQPFGQRMRQPLRHPAGVDEHQRGAVLADQAGEAVIDLRPHLARHHRLERAVGDLDGEVTRALMAGVDDGRIGRRLAADQEMRDRAHRVLRRRKADAQQPVAAQCREAFERQRQMRAALVRCNRVDFVDDHRSRRRQHLAPGLRAEQHVEQFRRGHQDMRRAPAHAVALGGGGVARAHPAPDIDIGQAILAELRADAGQRNFQIAMDVVGERFERRDIDDLDLLGQAAVEALADEVVDGDEERRKGLAGAGRRGDQRMPAGADRGPGIGLGRRRRAELIGEPPGDRGVEQLGADRRRDGLCPARPAGGNLARRSAIAGMLRLFPFHSFGGRQVVCLSALRSRPMAVGPARRLSGGRPFI